MRKKILAVAAIAMFGSIAAHAVPVKYDVSYNATAGSSGIGSFFFDNDVGAITDFNWTFGAITGGVVNGNYGSWNVFGDTHGRFVFEILSQTNSHSAVNCIGGGCGSSTGIIGSAPSGATSFSLSSQSNGANYSFSNSARGTVSIRQSVSVPEPTSISLFAAALLAFGFVARRRAKTKI